MFIKLGFTALLGFTFFITGCSPTLINRALVSELPTSSVVVSSSGSQMFFIGYNSNGYQKLFSSRNGVTTQISDIKPGASDEIHAVFGIPGSHIYKAGIITSNPAVLHLTDGLQTSAIDEVAINTSSFPFTMPGLTPSRDGSFIVYNTANDIKRVNTETGQIEALSTGGSALVENIGIASFIHSDYVYTKSVLGGVGKLYAYDLMTNAFSEVTGRSIESNLYVAAEGSTSMSAILLGDYAGAFYVISGSTAVNALAAGETYNGGLSFTTAPNFILFNVSTAGVSNLKRINDLGVTTLITGTNGVVYQNIIRGKARIGTVTGVAYSCYDIDSSSKVLLGNAQCSTFP